MADHRKIETLARHRQGGMGATPESIAELERRRAQHARMQARAPQSRTKERFDQVLRRNKQKDRDKDDQKEREKEESRGKFAKAMREGQGGASGNAKSGSGPSRRGRVIIKG